MSNKITIISGVEDDDDGGYPGRPQDLGFVNRVPLRRRHRNDSGPGSSPGFIRNGSNWAIMRSLVDSCLS